MPRSSLSRKALGPLSLLAKAWPAQPQDKRLAATAGLTLKQTPRSDSIRPRARGNPRQPGPQEEDADGTRSCLEACLGAWLSRDALGPLGTPVLMSPPSATRVAEAWEGPGASEPRHGRQLLLTA